MQINDAVPGDAYAMVRPNGTGHVGLVLRMPTAGDNRFNTISGNEANRVKVGLRRFSDLYMVGAVRVVDDADDHQGYERGLAKAKGTAGDPTR